MAYIKNSRQIFTPTTGGTVTILDGDGDIYCLINPAGTLATITINMPANPKDGQCICISSSQILTLITMGGGTINGALTTLAAINGYGSYVYDISGSKWYRVG